MKKFQEFNKKQGLKYLISLQIVNILKKSLITMRH